MHKILIKFWRNEICNRNLKNVGKNFCETEKYFAMHLKEFVRKIGEKFQENLKKSFQKILKISEDVRNFR